MEQRRSKQALSSRTIWHYSKSKNFTVNSNASNKRVKESRIDQIILEPKLFLHNESLTAKHKEVENETNRAERDLDSAICEIFGKTIRLDGLVENNNHQTNILNPENRGGISKNYICLFRG